MPKKTLKIRIVLCCMLLGSLLSCQGSENNTPTIGVTAKEIVLGQAAALTGPAQSLGQEMQAGALAYFESIGHF